MKPFLVLTVLLLAGVVTISAARSDSKPERKEFHSLAASQPAIWQEEPREFRHPTTTTTTTVNIVTTTSSPESAITPVRSPESPPPAEVRGSGNGDPNDMASWDRLAQCESGGDWHINTGNSYFGGLQFSLSSWRGVGGTGYPHEHSREEQIHRGQLLYAQGGWAHWPACTRSFGWR